MDLSIVIVNFNSGEYLEGCVTSLASQGDGSLEKEILVVDCGSTQDQSRSLERARAQGARVLALRDNLGYAGGCNRGLAASSGRFVAFLNADVVALEGCIPPLVEYLDRNPDAGFVEPRTFLDMGRRFLIPEVPELTGPELFRERAAQLTARAARRASLLRLRRNLDFWREETPREAATLSGAFLCTTRRTMERLHRFDEGYPLYYEDSDLFARCRAAGLRLVHLPASQAVHFAHRSVVTAWENAMAGHRAGRRRFIRKNLGRTWYLSNAAWEALVNALNRLHAPAPPPSIELGAPNDPPVLECDGDGGPFVLQLSFDPHLLFAAGCLAGGNRFEFSRETWETLAPGLYFLRAVDLETFGIRGAWRVRRTPTPRPPCPQAII